MTLYISRVKADRVVQIVYLLKITIIIIITLFI